MGRRLAILAGCTRLDPDAYGGWEGECPGCDRDVARFATLCHDEGFDGIWVLVNEAASSDGLKSAFLSALDKPFTPDDLLVLFFSGHGGQQPDVSGDEWDGKDETLCLWDGELLDDRIAEYLAMLPEGLRVFFVTDSCNSGTNFRGMRRAQSSPIVLPPLDDLRIQARVLHFGGCTDGRYSHGEDDGGWFTNALLASWGYKRKPLSYAKWWHRSWELMKKKYGRQQVPSIAQQGVPYWDDMEAMR